MCACLCVRERKRGRGREGEEERERVFLNNVCETLAVPLKPQTANLILGPLRSIIIIAIRNNYYLLRWVGSLEPAWDRGFSQELRSTKDRALTHKCFNMFGRHPALGSLHWVSYTSSCKLNEEFIKYRPGMNEHRHAKLFDWMPGFLAFL